MSESTAKRTQRWIRELLVRPYTRRELPGWGKLYALLVGSHWRDAFWAPAGRRTVRGKLHGYRMELDLGGWSERLTYFLGRYYDLPSQLLMIAVLRPGERFCDVGANIGMLSLLASRLVGPQGCVDAFEPNPECCTRIEHAIRENAIGNIRIQRVGLADRSGTMQLEVPCVNPGEGTLAGSPYPSSEVRSLVVRVVTGDELILDGGSPPALIKIDVEGFECRVIDGLQRTLSEHRPPVVTEVVRAHLGRAGESVHTLFARMHDLGYEAYALGTVRRLFRHRLELHPVDASTLSASTDVLWVHASRVHPVIERLLLRSPT